ncbi:hypothetical protein JOC24_006607 [Streptomyces sp. HB132]|nr:hypothetical protein [Streptomyces sp. HB132]
MQYSRLRLPLSHDRLDNSYAKAFAGLAEMAVHGDAARALIRDAIDALE